MKPFAPQSKPPATPCTAAPGAAPKTMPANVSPAPFSSPSAPATALVPYTAPRIKPAVVPTSTPVVLLSAAPTALNGNPIVHPRIGSTFLQPELDSSAKAAVGSKIETINVNASNFEFFNILICSFLNLLKITEPKMFIKPSCINKENFEICIFLQNV